MDNVIENKTVSSNIVSFPLENKVFTYGEYDNFFSTSPKFTWKDYKIYKHTVSRCYKSDSPKIMMLDDIITFK